MSCFICGEENEVLIFSCTNDKKLNICNHCYDVLLNREIRCSHCNRKVDNFETKKLSAKIGRNGIICEHCEQNGIRVLEGTFSFKYVPNNLQGYSYKPQPNFYHMDNETDNLYLGVELEIGGLRNYDNVYTFCDNHAGSIFYFKTDASIHGAGCEIVTHPATLAYHLSDKSGWEEIFEDFHNHGFISGSATNTGLHIHVNKNCLTTKQIKKIDLLVNQYESLFSIIGRRTGNRYCAYTQKTYSQLGYSVSRYQSVNFSNGNTVEFRFFNGTNNVEELFASLECVKMIVLISENITYDEIYESEEAVKNKIKELIKRENFKNLRKMLIYITGDNSWAI